MTNIPFAKGDMNRLVAASPRITTKNRFMEGNPALNQGPFSAIARPAMKKFLEVGTGPVRGVFSAPGLFDDDLFVVSGQFLYRVSSADGTASTVGQISTSLTGDVSWAPVAPIGAIPARLFIAEGGVLYVYTENGQAQGLLQASGAIADGNVVRIDETYYEFESGALDGSAPAGTAANPWRVLLGGSAAASIENLYKAINDSGIAGTTYSTALTAHPTVQATAYDADDLYVHAIDPGVAGNAIETTETGANIAWGAATLEDGGDPQLRQANMPDGIGAISIAHINSYVIVVPVQDEALETVGRFYWIEPGETTAAADAFATAERSADKIHQVGVFGNLFWLFNQTTTEPWMTTGDADAPMQRYQSILFDRGSWAGTAIQVKDSLIVVDEDGAVFQIAGGQTRISRPDIEERIRRAIQIEEQLG